MREIGEPAPHFSAAASDGRRVSLKDFAGRWLVLYFYPKAFTPGCTREAKRFRDNHGELEALGAAVVGVSHDDLSVQCEFAKALDLKFPLVADSDRTIAQAYGVSRAVLPIDRRITYIIDPEGTIQGVFHHEFQISKHLDDVVRFLEKVPR